MSKVKDFERDIAAVINSHGIDSYLQMPDYILASYVMNCLQAMKRANEDSLYHSGIEERQA